MRSLLPAPDGIFLPDAGGALQARLLLASPPSDGLSSQAAAPHSIRNPQPCSMGGPGPPLLVLGGKVGAWGWCKAQPGVLDAMLG